MKPLHFKNVVIAGARGFIGRTLTDALEGKAQVLALDLPELNITSKESLAAALPDLRAFAAAGPTVLINAAGLMDAALSRREPDRFYAVNGTAAGHLKGWAREAGVAGFLHLSSETVFGAGAEPFADDAPRVPQHPYGVSKLVAELVLADDAEQAPPVVGLRLPVIVGTGQAIGNPISMFCDEALKTHTITLFNGGTHRRKFLHVNDVIGQILAVLTEPMKPGYICYNVGGTPASMREVADTVAARVGGVTIKDQESKNQAFTLLSTSDRVEAAYGFKPQMSLAGMIDTFIAQAK